MALFPITSPPVARAYEAGTAARAVATATVAPPVADRCKGVSWTLEYSPSFLARRRCCSPGWSRVCRVKVSPSARLSGRGWPRGSGSSSRQMMHSRVQQAKIT